MRAVRILQALLVCADPLRTARFYAAALGAVVEAPERVSDPVRLTLLKAGDRAVMRIAMRIGREAVALLGFDPPGRPYPEGSTATDLWFQHLAIVVDDIDAVHRQVMAAGALPLTHGGPQQLPASSGGVRAFKFRDPEGHPLELLQVPSGGGDRWRRDGHAAPLVRGLDHSAIAVRDVSASRAFYQSTLGLQPGPATLNEGPAQVALDAVPAVRVDVLPLMPAEATPHLELLGYRTGLRRAAAGRVGDIDVAATRLVVEVDGDAPPTVIDDPDGHRLVILPKPQNDQAIAKI